MDLKAGGGRPPGAGTGSVGPAAGEPAGRDGAAGRVRRNCRTCCSPGKSVRHVKSNAIVLARGGQLIGLGAGQVNRAVPVIWRCRWPDRGRGIGARLGCLLPASGWPGEPPPKAGVKAIIQRAARRKTKTRSPSPTGTDGDGVHGTAALPALKKAKVKTQKGRLTSIDFVGRLRFAF